LDRNANTRITDDTLEGKSTALHKLTGQPPVTSPSRALALRQEEEESTQDLLEEAKGAISGDRDSSIRQGDEMQGGQDKVCPCFMYLLQA
jgi:hypothetical protein